MLINKEEYLRSYKYGYIPNYDFYKQDVIYMWNINFIINNSKGDKIFIPLLFISLFIV